MSILGCSARKERLGFFLYVLIVLLECRDGHGQISVNRPFGMAPALSRSLNVDAVRKLE